MWCGVSSQHKNFDNLFVTDRVLITPSNCRREQSIFDSIQLRFSVVPSTESVKTVQRSDEPSSVANCVVLSVAVVTIWITIWKKRFVGKRNQTCHDVIVFQLVHQNIHFDNERQKVVIEAV